MSGIHYTAGTSRRPITIGDQTFQIRPMTLGDNAEMETHIVGRRGNPFVGVTDALKRGVPSSMLGPMMEAAAKSLTNSGSATPQEVADFQQSPEGAAFMFWRMARRDNPSVESLEKAREIVFGTAQIDWVIALVQLRALSGEDELKKSASPASPTPTAGDDDTAAKTTATAG